MHDIQIPLRPRRPLSLGIVTETWPPEVNGVARAVRLMVDGLIARGHHVGLIRPRQRADDSAAPAPGIEASGRFREHLTRAITIPGYSQLQLGAAWPDDLQAIWRRSPPDLVHVVTEGPLGWAAVIAARRLGIPVSSDFHTNFHSYSRHYGVAILSSPVAALLRVLHNWCDCTMVPTGEMRRDLATLDFRRLAIVGRGIDTGLFCPERRSDALRRSWDCGPSDTVVLCVSRIAAEKNLDLFVHTTRAMRSLKPDLRVVMVGDGPELARLRKRCPEIIFTGMQTGEALAAHYASGDLFLFPSVTETFGNVTVEAMASGLAVLAYDYAAAREYIEDGVSGVLAPYDDAEAFITRARWMLQSPACLPALRAKARSRALEVSADRALDELEQVLLAVAERALVLPTGTVISAQRT